MVKRYFSLASIILLFLIGCSENTGMKDPNVSTTSHLNLKEGSYNIIREKSELKWTGKEFSSKTHTGTLFLKEGRININSNGMIEGKVVIDERKEKQIEHAKTLSKGAVLIKLGDKISNVTDVINNPPSKWDINRRKVYLDWAEKVISNCPQVNEKMESKFQEVLSAGRESLI